MADFNTAYKITLTNEGTYSNDIDDTGGETVCGVSRNNFPLWAGWAIVDKYGSSLGKGTQVFKQAIQQDDVLQGLIEAWYKENFWDKFDLDKLNSQELANEVFDQSVNVGVGQCTKFIQRAINAFNRSYQFGADLLVDGAVGPSTRAKLVDIGNNPDYTDCITKAIDALQGAFYVELGNKKESYRTFTRGWFRTRVGTV